MKICVLFLLIGLANAKIWQHVTSVVNEAVESFSEDIGKTGSLKAIIDLPNVKELDDIEDDIKNNLGKLIKDNLENRLKRIIERVENGKKVTEKFVEKVRKIKEKLQDLKKNENQNAKEITKKLKGMVNKFLKELLEKYGIATRNLDQELDLFARAKFSEFVEKIKKQLLESETINMIRGYIKTFVSANPDIQNLKEFLLKLEDENFRELLDTIFTGYNKNSCNDKKSLEKLNKLFKDLIEQLSDKATTLHRFLKLKWEASLVKLRSHFTEVNHLAIDIIATGKDDSVKIIEEAIEFLKQYKDDLGSLWNQIIEIAHSHIGVF